MNIFIKLFMMWGFCGILNFENWTRIGWDMDRNVFFGQDFQEKLIFWLSFINICSYFPLDYMVIDQMGHISKKKIKKKKKLSDRPTLKNFVGLTGNTQLLFLCLMSHCLYMYVCIVRLSSLLHKKASVWKSIRLTEDNLLIFMCLTRFM